MGLSVFTFIWDFLKQSFVLLLAGILFFLVIHNATSDAFYQRYYAKDTGLIVSTIHAARGDLLLRYGKLQPAHTYDYSLTDKDLLLRDNGATRWEVRKRFGMDITADGVRTEEKLLINPLDLTFRKDGKTITMSGLQRVASGCPPLDEVPARAETSITVTGSSPLVTARLERLASLFPPERPPQRRIIITVREGNTRLIRVSGGGTDQPLANTLACTLKRHLAPLPVEIVPKPGDAADATITIEHPAELPGLTDAKLLSATTQMLDEVLR